MADDKTNKELGFPDDYEVVDAEIVEPPDPTVPPPMGELFPQAVEEQEKLAQREAEYHQAVEQREAEIMARHADADAADTAHKEKLRADEEAWQKHVADESVHNDDEDHHFVPGQKGHAEPPDLDAVIEQEQLAREQLIAESPLG